MADLEELEEQWVFFPEGISVRDKNAQEKKANNFWGILGRYLDPLVWLTLWGFSCDYTFSKIPENESYTGIIPPQVEACLFFWGIVFFLDLLASPLKLQICREVGVTAREENVRKMYKLVERKEEHRGNLRRRGMLPEKKAIIIPISMGVVTTLLNYKWGLGYLTVSFLGALWFFEELEKKAAAFWNLNEDEDDDEALEELEGYLEMGLDEGMIWELLTAQLEVGENKLQSHRAYWQFKLLGMGVGFGAWQIYEQFFPYVSVPGDERPKWFWLYPTPASLQSIFNPPILMAVIMTSWSLTRIDWGYRLKTVWREWVDEWKNLRERNAVDNGNNLN